MNFIFFFLCFCLVLSDSNEERIPFNNDYSSSYNENNYNNNVGNVPMNIMHNDNNSHHMNQYQQYSHSTHNNLMQPPRLKQTKSLGPQLNPNSNTNNAKRMLSLKQHQFNHSYDPALQQQLNNNQHNMYNQNQYNNQYNPSNINNSNYLAYQRGFSAFAQQNNSNNNPNLHSQHNYITNNQQQQFTQQQQHNNYYNKQNSILHSQYKHATLLQQQMQQMQQHQRQQQQHQQQHHQHKQQQSYPSPYPNHQYNPFISNNSQIHQEQQQTNHFPKPSTNTNMQKLKLKNFNTEPTPQTNHHKPLSIQQHYRIYDDSELSTYGHSMTALPSNSLYNNKGHNNNMSNNINPHFNSKQLQQLQKQSNTSIEFESYHSQQNEQHRQWFKHQQQQQQALQQQKRNISRNTLQVPTGPSQTSYNTSFNFELPKDVSLPNEFQFDVETPKATNMM